MSTQSTEFGPVGTDYGSAGPWDFWIVHASSGEYSVPAESLGHALLRFMERHPDDFVHAIVLPADVPVPAASTAATVTELLSEYADFELIRSGDVCGVPVSAVYRDATTEGFFRITIESTNGDDQS